MSEKRYTGMMSSHEKHLFLKYVKAVWMEVQPISPFTPRLCIPLHSCSSVGGWGTKGTLHSHSSDHNGRNCPAGNAYY